MYIFVQTLAHLYIYAYNRYVRMINKKEKKMGLILVKEMPKAKKEYTRDELCVGFDRFNKLSQKLHKLHNLGKKFKPLHWKDEQEAIIMKRDFDLIQQAVGYFTGSELEIEEVIGTYKLHVYSAGYWINIGS